jgi:hypothetical protein
VIAEKNQKRSQGPRTEDKVPAGRTISGDVPERPDGLFSDIGLRAAEQLDEDWDRTSLDDDLGLLGRAGGNVGQRPGSLELHQGVWRSQELDEAADHTGFDDLLDGRVSLLGEKLSELGRGLDLSINLIGEDAFHHLWQFHIELEDIRIISIDT